MQPRKFRILSAITAGSLALAVAAITASSGTSQPATHAALAANTASSPPVNLDNCPMLSEGDQDVGCVSQLQTELNTILGLNLSVDGTFGSTTKQAVERFQQEHNIVPADGIVGPQTKAALDNPGSSTAGTPPGQLNPGQQITSGTQIASPDGKYVLQMQSDGNLVLRAPGNIPLGDTRTAGHDGTIAVMQTDGNFVLRAPGNIPIWTSGTDGHPGTVLQVQDDGRVVLYAPGHQVLRVLFSTPTVPPVPAPPASVPAPPASVPAPPASVPAPPASVPAPPGLGDALHLGLWHRDRVFQPRGDPGHEDAGGSRDGRGGDMRLPRGRDARGGVCDLGGSNVPVAVRGGQRLRGWEVLEDQASDVLGVRVHEFLLQVTPPKPELRATSGSASGGRA